MESSVMRTATREAKIWKKREKESMAIIPPRTVISSNSIQPYRYMEIPREVTAPVSARDGSHFFSLDPTRSIPKTSTTLKKRTSCGSRNKKICTMG